MSIFRRTLCVLTITAFTAITAAAQSTPLRIDYTTTKGVAQCNYTGITGNQELSELVKQYMSASGWFTLTGGSADYRLTGTANATTCRFTLTGAGSTYTDSVSFSSPRDGARKLVDKVLGRIYADDGIGEMCRSRIAFCVDIAPGKRDIYICDITGADIKQLTDFTSLCVEPTWSPNSSSVAYTKYSRSSTDIFETKVANMATRRLTSFSGLNAGAAFDPAFKRIAFIASFEKTVNLYMKDLASGTQTRITSGPSVEASPTWSPSGNAICYVSNEGGNVPRLFIADLTTKKRGRVENITGEAATPDWSKSNKIAFSSKYNGSYKLAVYDVEKGTTEIITTEPGDWESPSWAPDSRHIVCARTLGGKTELVIVDTMAKAAKTAKIRVLKGDLKMMMPSWSPGAVK